LRLSRLVPALCLAAVAFPASAAVSSGTLSVTAVVVDSCMVSAGQDARPVLTCDRAVPPHRIDESRGGESIALQDARTTIFF
jgi:hypothetical protein